MLTVAGLAPSVDLTYLVDRLRLGAIHRPTEAVRVAGGKPLNLARAAAALGAEVTVVAVLGGWTGDWLADELARVGIRVQRVTTPRLTRTCVSISSADAEELTEVYEYAEPIPDDVWARLRAALQRELSNEGSGEGSGGGSGGRSGARTRRPGWLAISGGPPRGLARDALAELASIGRAAGCRVAADTHGPSLGPLLDAGPDLVKINRSEAAEVLGVDTDGSLPDMARALQDRTGGTVVLTDGVDGSLGLEPGGRVVTVPAPTVRGRFPVGSGDSYLGGLLTALERGDDLPAALRLATAAGVANAQVPGPGNFDPALVARLAGAT